MQEVSIHDGRSDKQSSSLDVEGFRLVSQKTEVQDFYDELQVEQTYHEEVKTLLMEMTARRVLKYLMIRDAHLLLSSKRKEDSRACRYRSQ